MLTFQVIEYVDKLNSADLSDYQQPNATWFDSYDLSTASWNNLTFDNVSQTVTLRAVNDTSTVLPFLANGSLSFKASAIIFSLNRTPDIFQYLYKRLVALKHHEC